MKRVGILGGTFNPVHIGHLAIAQTVCDRMGLDKVLFIPSYYPPHKGHKNVVSTDHRYKMLKLATKGNAKFHVNDFEIKHPRRSYSIETLKHLHSVYPKGTQFFFIIGSDMLPGLNKWKDIDELLRLCRFVAVSRKGYKKKKIKYSVRTIETLDLGISSSYLRRCLKAKKTVRYLLPDNVLNYIKRHKLYS